MHGPDQLPAPARRRLALCAALAVAAGCAAAADGARIARSLRAQAVAVDCQPALPYFCANIHVACSGRTALRTFAFQLRAGPDRGWIEAAAHPSGIPAQYENGRVDWDPEAAYVVLRPRGAGGYIKLLADGSYSFRHYAKDGASMSHGLCR